MTPPDSIRPRPSGHHRPLLRLWLGILGILTGQLGFADPVVVGSPLTLSEADTLYDGTDLVVSNTTLTLNGSHSFKTLALTHGAVLTHSPCTATETHKLEVVVSGEMVISANSVVDVKGRGYLAGRTSGNTIVGGATGPSGASYGGPGGRHRGEPNRVYGDYADPNDWGSGGTWAGGGLVRVEAGTLQLDGAIIADGGTSAALGGGGSGGGVLLRVNVLRGGGQVAATGGQGGITGYNAGGGGGGGRVAVYAADLSGFDLGRLRAAGGIGMRSPEQIAPDGAPGTVYIRETQRSEGTLIFRAGTSGSSLGALGLPGDTLVRIPDVVWVEGAGTRVGPEHAGLTIEFQQDVRVVKSGSLTVSNDVVFLAGLTITNGGLVEVSGDFFLGPQNNLLLKDGGRLSVDGELSSSGALALGPGGLVTCRSYSSGAPLVLNGGVMTVDALTAPSLSLTNGATLTHLACTATETHKLEVVVSGEIVISANSVIDVKGRGYLAGRTSGNIAVGAATGSSGGSYGGPGGRYKGEPNRVYGGYADPSDWGSGGTSPGGGLVRVEAGSLQLDGTILADGGSGLAQGGGGSGGGVRLKANQIRGSGQVLAGGGQGSVSGSAANGYNLGSGGGGGRIAVYASDLTGFDLGQLRAAGGGGTGFGGQIAPDGAPGTVYIRETQRSEGTLIFRAGTSGSSLGALGLPGDSLLKIPDVVLVEGAGTRIGPEHAGLTIEFQQDVRVVKSGSLTVSNDVVFLAGLTITNGGLVEVSGDFSLGPQNNLLLKDGGRLSVDGELSSSGALALGPGGLVTCRSYLSGAPLVLSGGVMTVDALTAPSLTLTNGATLTHLPCTATETHKLEVVVSGEMVISANSVIDVKSRGYLAGRTSGNTNVEAATGSSGGSYGGPGGRYKGEANRVYGDYADPNDWGSGGTSPGGGLVRVEAGSLQLDGTILADGGSGLAQGGGGSGGGVRLKANQIRGSGQVLTGGGQGSVSGSAANGYNLGSGGGGGRIALYASDLTGFDLGHLRAAGGGGTSFGGQIAPDGAPGSIYTAAIAPGPHASVEYPYHPYLFTGVSFTGYMRVPMTNGIELRFNVPMDSLSLAPATLEIAGPLGRVSIEKVVVIDDYRCRYLFPAQIENGAYRFTLSPHVRAADGSELDQDLDGAGGEPEDAFTFTLILDTVRPRFTHQEPAGDIAGTLSFIDVWSSEALDPSAFRLSDVVVTNSGGGQVAPNRLEQVGLNRWRVSFPPQTAPGQYGLRIAPTVTDLAGNSVDFASTAAAPINLVAVNLQLFDVALSTNALIAGDPITVQWKGRNATGAPLLGAWTDGIYLSRDAIWSIDDLPLGSILHTNGLPANGTYENLAEVYVPGVLPGDWHIVVRADIYNQSKEGLGEADNQVATGPLSSTVRSIIPDSGGVQASLSAQSRAHYYAITVQPGQSLRLKLAGAGIGAVSELHASLEAVPDRYTSEFRSAKLGSSQEVLLTGPAGGGTLFVLVYGSEIGSDGAYSLQAEAGEFFVTSLSPNSHGLNASEWTWEKEGIRTIPRLTLAGVGLDASTAVEFTHDDGQVRTPSAITVVSRETLLLDLELGEVDRNGVLLGTAWKSGAYTVAVKKGSRTSILPDRFTVTMPKLPKFQASLVVPGAISPGFPVRQTVWVEYENSGGAAMPAPLLTVTTEEDSVLTVDEWVANSIRGDPTLAAALTNKVIFMVKGSGGTPGTLQPGDRGRVPLYYLGLRQNRGVFDVNFTVQSARPDHIAQSCVSLSGGSGGGGGRTVCPGESYSFFWNKALARKHKPAGIEEEAWWPVFQNIGERMGTPVATDVGHYVTMLANRMNDLALGGQYVTDPGRLFNFEVALASGAMHPVRTLSSVLDASIPAPGFPLAFRRSFANGIIPRYRLGPLGRGWVHSWEVSSQVLGNGDVLVRGPLGSDRFFRAAPGGYVATDGDQGQLKATPEGYRLTESDQTVWQFAPDLRLASVSDRNGNRITLEYRAEGLVAISHSSGQRLVLEYHASGRLARVIHRAGAGLGADRVTEYGYDGSAEYLQAVTKPGGFVTSYSYIQNQTEPFLKRRHALAAVVHPDATEENFEYDAQGRLVANFSKGGAQRITYQFDGGAEIAVTDSTGRRTTLRYGLGASLVEERDGEGRAVQFGYDDAFRLRRLSGPGGELYRYEVDKRGNTKSVENPLRHLSEFVYDPAFNRLARIIDARGNPLRYEYDARGNVTAIGYADDSRETFGYDEIGLVTTSTNRRGGVITYAYSSLAKLVSKDYDSTPGITDFTYAYDASGNLTNATYWNPALAVYESLNLRYEATTDRLVRIEYPGGRFFEFAYDPVGRRVRRADQDGHVTGYVYDDLGRLGRMTNELGDDIVRYEYDLAGRLSRKTLGNGVFTTYAYNQAGQVTQLVNSRSDNTVLSRFTYSYDASGRRDSMTTLAGKESYGYDALGQLTSVTYPDGRIVQYVYDAAGNRKEVVDNGVPEVYVANSLNQYTSAGDATFGYDADGNLTQKSEPGAGTSYTYDAENRLVGVITPTETWTYTYDAFGNRITATENGVTTRYIVDPTGLGNVAAEYDASDSLIARYEHGFGLLTRQDAAGNQAYYTFSAIGHTSELTAPSGSVANSYAYDPFGLSVSKSEAIPNPFEFVGEFGVMSEVSGLKFMRARFYQPLTGGFIQHDVVTMVISELNLYQYARNNPPNRLDPLGLMSWDSFSDKFVDWQQGVESDVNRLYGDRHQLGVDLLHYEVAKRAARELRRNGLSAFDAFTTTLGAGVLWELVRLNPDELKDDLLGDLAGAFDGAVLPDPGGNDEDKKRSSVPRSSDPNDKVAPGGSGILRYVPQSRWVSYQVRFENLRSATAPAQKVVVVDVLADDLDLDTLELLEVELAGQTVAIPRGPSSYETRVPFRFGNYDLLVDLRAELDRGNRTLSFSLQAVDPATGWAPEDPLVGLLAPEDGSGRGQGSVSYTIRPKVGLPTGRRIENRARIWFDWNDPIDTPAVFNTLDAGMPESRVLPIEPPAVGQTNFTVRWSGVDDVGGSGVESYEVYAAEAGGEFVRVLGPLDASQTSTELTGVAGRTYHFYSIARDHVGHIEEAPLEPDATITLSDVGLPVAQVVGRFLAYNNSSWDGGDAALNSADDLAIASDKAALLPGGTATFANYSSFGRGINEVVVDIDGLAETPTVADFTFKAGNSNDPGAWSDAPAPLEIAVRSGAGTGASDRVSLRWADNAIEKEWLQVTVLATENTGLGTPDVFYFGNAIGDTGDSTANAQVNVLDEGAVRSHPRNFLHPAPIDSPYDFNRDKNVNTLDEALARANATSFLTALRLIAPQPAGALAFSSAATATSTSGSAPTVLVATKGVAATPESPGGTDVTNPVRLRISTVRPGEVILEATPQGTNSWVLQELVSESDLAWSWRDSALRPEAGGGGLSWLVRGTAEPRARFFRLRLVPNQTESIPQGVETLP